MTKKNWINWLKCNALEVITLILVLAILVLVIRAFSAPAVEGTGTCEVPTIVAVEEPAALGEAPLEGAPAAEVPLEGTPTEDVPIEETPTE